jgi:hypothetical protein
MKYCIENTGPKGKLVFLCRDGRKMFLEIQFQKINCPKKILEKFVSKCTAKNGNKESQKYKGV